MEPSNRSSVVCSVPGKFRVAMTLGDFNEKIICSCCFRNFCNRRTFLLPFIKLYIFRNIFFIFIKGFRQPVRKRTDGRSLRLCHSFGLQGCKQLLFGNRFDFVFRYSKRICHNVRSFILWILRGNQDCNCKGTRNSMLTDIQYTGRWKGNGPGFFIQSNNHQVAFDDGRVQLYKRLCNL